MVKQDDLHHRNGAFYENEGNNCGCRKSKVAEVLMTLACQGEIRGDQPVAWVLQAAQAASAWHATNQGRSRNQSSGSGKGRGLEWHAKELDRHWSRKATGTFQNPLFLLL